MKKETYRPGEKLEEAACRLLAHMNELAMDLKSIKSVFPESPTVKSEYAGRSITWTPLEQLPTNLMIGLPSWSIPQNDDRLPPDKHQQDIRVVAVHPTAITFTDSHE